MNHPQHLVDHEEAAMLLPWYVNDTLDDAERRRVEQHIESCPRCRDDLELLANVRRAVHSGSPAPLVPAPDKARLLTELDRAERPAARRPWPWIAVAASVVAVAALLVWQLVPRLAPAPVLFETATAPAATPAINFGLEVRFTPDVGPEERNAFFETIGARELAVPLNERVFRVALGLGPVTLAELEQRARQFESRPGIAAARFVAVQLPVE
jgi:hypothetical protein